MDEVRKLIDDCLELNLLWLKNCTEGSEEYKKVLSDVNALHRMRMDEIKAENEKEIAELRAKIDSMKSDTELEIAKVRAQADEVKAKRDMETNRSKNDRSGQAKSDILKTIVGFAGDVMKCLWSTKLADQILRYEENGIIRSKAYPLAQNLFRMK